MFNLTDSELQAAYEAVGHHGYSTMLPEPVEWAVLRSNWTDVKQYLAQKDLDIYEPHKLLRIFAPKSRANIRVVHLLHPEDLLLYTALILIVKDDLEKARVPKRARRVFSYRAQIDIGNRLYDARGTHDEYLDQLHAKANKASTKFVGIADIADFYPRIYQHRLENIIETTASSQRGVDVARVLVKKMIAKLMGRNSYGIPVGPYASRLLGEAVLIDVDAHLQAQRVDFVRWVDDYNIFARSEFLAQRTLFELGEWLYSHHGLTLQSAKTKLLPVEAFCSDVLSRPERALTDRDQVIALLRGDAVPGDYETDDDEEEEEPDELAVQELMQQLQSYDLHALLSNSISDVALVDYEVVRYVLTRIPRIPGADLSLKRDLLDLVLDNAELLYPAAEYVAGYVLAFQGLTPQQRKAVARKLLKPLKSKRNPPPDYYAMWVLHVFSTDEKWNHAADIVQLYERSSSEVLRRYAALALAKCGTRAHAVRVKDDLANASSLLRLAILTASSQLGSDERKHWRLSHSTSGILEKFL